MEISVKIDGKETKLILLGREKDYDPKNLEDALDGFPGSFMNEVYMDPSTKKCYIENYLRGWNEYDEKTTIQYIR